MAQTAVPLVGAAELGGADFPSGVFFAFLIAT